MDIRQYYKSISIVFLNSSLLTVLLAAISFSLATVLQVPYVWHITSFFMTFSIFYFIRHLIYNKRAISVPVSLDFYEGSFFCEKNILIAYLPSATLRMLLFHPNGTLLGEIKDQDNSWYYWFLPDCVSKLFPHTYIMTNQKKEPIATYKTGSCFSNNVKIYNHDGILIGEYKERFKKSMLRYKGIVTKRDESIVIDVNVSGFLTSFSLDSSEGHPIVKFQKGYLPLEWGTKFQLNTPVLSFSETATVEEQLYTFGICTRLFKYKGN